MKYLTLTSKDISKLGLNGKPIEEIDIEKTFKEYFNKGWELITLLPDVIIFKNNNKTLDK